jgi:hypothetical protein
VRAVERPDAEVDDADRRPRPEAGVRATAAALERVGREPRPRAGGDDPTGVRGSSLATFGAVTMAAWPGSSAPMSRCFVSSDARNATSETRQAKIIQHATSHGSPPPHPSSAADSVGEKPTSAAPSSREPAKPV